MALSSAARRKSALSSPALKSHSDNKSRFSMPCYRYNK
jgi:hypothetical protein